MTEKSIPNQSAPQYMSVGAGHHARKIAYRHQSGAPDAPCLLWLGGFKSDMDGTKALALGQYAKTHGFALTRFDYSGHGLSGGRFVDGTISRWLEEAEAIVHATAKPYKKLVVVGSSMGGWLALLLNNKLKQTDHLYRVYGLILIAPALDMTADLMWDKMSEQEKNDLRAQGSIKRTNDYSDEPYIITKQLIEDGRQYLFQNRVIETGCPVVILQGGQDNDVPASHGLKLASQITLDDIVFRLIPDADHRMSRPQDIQVLYQAIETLQTM